MPPTSDFTNFQDDNFKVQYNLIICNPKSIFRLKQGAKEPEHPRTAAINTNLEDLGEEMIKDIFVGGIDSANKDQVPESFCKKNFHDF